MSKKNCIFFLSKSDIDSLTELKKSLKGVIECEYIPKEWIEKNDFIA